jgi:hypothetical protein
LGIRLRGGKRYRARWLLPALGLSLALMLLAGCSTSGSSGGTNISLGLAGSTADHPAPPPTVAANGPNDTYAFVYDNQIWVRQSNNANPTKITGLVLSNGADISWGPLVWSPDGSQIAFALVENLTPNTPSSTSGPIYVVNVAKGDTIVTPGIGSIYGHSYAWYGNNMLFYASGDGVLMYDVNDPDPRVWQVISAVTSQDNQTFSNNSNVIFGDIAITKNNDLYYSAAQVSSFGGTGTVGSASIYQVGLPSLGQYNSVYQANKDNSPNAIAIWLYNQFLPMQNISWNNNQIAGLGHAYADTGGAITMGAWQVSGDENHLVYQVIDGVDTHAQTVSSHFCTNNSGCSGVLSGVGKYAQSIHGQLSLSPDASHIAFTGDALYVQATGGGNVNKFAASVGWNTPAAMTHNGSLAIATQIVASSTDSNGVLRIQTNLVAFDGQNNYVLISGAQDATWKP